MWQLRVRQGEQLPLTLKVRRGIREKTHSHPLESPLQRFFGHTKGFPRLGGTEAGRSENRGPSQCPRVTLDLARTTGVAVARPSARSPRRRWGLRKPCYGLLIFNIVSFVVFWWALQIGCQLQFNCFRQYGSKISSNQAAAATTVFLTKVGCVRHASERL